MKPCCAASASLRSVTSNPNPIREPSERARAKSVMSSAVPSASSRKTLQRERSAAFTAKLVPEYAPYAEYDQLMRRDEWYGRE